MTSTRVRNEGPERGSRPRSLARSSSFCRVDFLLAMTVRDVLDIFSTGATAVAAYLAWRAIRNGNKQAKESADRIVLERRLDFELDVLKELFEVLRMRPNDHGSIRLRLELLKPDGLSVARAAYGLEGAEGLQDLDELLIAAAPTEDIFRRTFKDSDDTVLRRVSAEVHDRIVVRLAQRDPEAVSRRCGRWSRGCLWGCLRSRTRSPTALRRTRSR